MDEAHDAEPEHSPYIRLPWALVAAGLGGVLLLALGLGLFANRYLRPQLEVSPTTPTAVAAAAAAPVPTPTPAPAVAPTRAAAATAVPVATGAAPTTPSTQFPTVSASPTSAPITSAPTPSALPTLDAVGVDEVGKAYEKYWQVRTQALLQLDKTHLEEVMSGNHLASVAKRIDELSTENRAIKTSVDHDFQVVQLDAGAAQVFDDYISDSIYVDPVSQKPLSEPASDELRVLYRLTKLDGKWKVEDSASAD